MSWGFPGASQVPAVLKKGGSGRAGNPDLWGWDEKTAGGECQLSPSLASSARPQPPAKKSQLQSPRLSTEAKGKLA